MINCKLHSKYNLLLLTLTCTIFHDSSGKSKTNVKELFDSSVPLDIEDLKAEFDNAPVPSLDNDDILRGIPRLSSLKIDF